MRSRLTAKKSYGSFCLAGFLFLLPFSVSAETVRTKRDTKVFSDMGEQSRVVTKARRGAELLVLRKEGRWYKVRVNGRTGWITRSNLAVSKERRPSRGREVSFVEGRDRKDSAKEAPRDRAGADTVRDGAGDFLEGPEERGEKLKPIDRAPRESQPARKSVEVRVSETDLFAKASENSEPIEIVSKGEVLAIFKEKRKWYLVEHRSGKKGWIYAEDVRIVRTREPARSSRPTSSTSASRDNERFDELEIDIGSSEAYRYQKVTKSAFANLGLSTLSQKFSSASQQPLGNYVIGANAATLGLGGDFLYDFSEKILLGADARVALGKAIPGIRFMDETIGFTNINVDVMGKVGYKFGSATGLAAYGRLGAYLGQMSVDRSTVEPAQLNAARLPSEALFGPKLGFGVEAPRLGSGKTARKISARAKLDFMLPFLGTTRKQTAGLEDGASSSANAIFLALNGNYQWKKSLHFTADYQFYRAATNWNGVLASQRGHDAANASRVDMSHSLLFGLGAYF